MKMNGGRIPVLPFKKNKKFHLAIRIEFKSIQKEIKSKVIISNKINGSQKNIQQFGIQEQLIQALVIKYLMSWN